MKKLLVAALFTMSSLNAFSQVQDPGVGTTAREFRERVDQEFDEIENAMNLNIQSRALSFPDYKVAAEDLLATMKRARATYQGRLTGIEDFLSWYDSIAREYEKDPHNRAIRNLLEKKKEELKGQQSRYQQASLQLVILDGLLAMPVKISPRPGKYLPATLIAIAAVATPAGMVIAGTAGAGAFFGSACFLFLESWIMGASFEVEMSETNLGQWTVAGAVKDSQGQLVYKSNQGQESARAFKERSLGVVGEKVFSKCQTQGCVYYLAEDIYNWVSQTENMADRLSIPVKGVKDFKFKLPAAKFKYRKSIDKMADMAATNKKVSM